MLPAAIFSENRFSLLRIRLWIPKVSPYPERFIFSMTEAISECLKVV